MTGPPGRQTGAEVFDLGYRHYEGLREGRARARRAIYINGLRTTLGLGRGTMAKVLAILMSGAAMVPAVIMAVVASLLEPAVRQPCPPMPTTMNWSRWCCSCLPLSSDRNCSVRTGATASFTSTWCAPSRLRTTCRRALAGAVHGDPGPRIFGTAGALDRDWCCLRPIPAEYLRQRTGWTSRASWAQAWWWPCSWPLRRWRWPRSPTGGRTPLPS